jgi:hypothetical protein
MSGRRANPRLIKKHRSYSVEEAALKLDVHKNSIRSWIKAGLPTLDNSRPTLILGGELKAWLDKKRKAAKRPCSPGTFYCFKCRTPKSPALGIVEYRPINDTSGNLIALCTDCGTTMHRRARLEAVGSIMPNLAIQITEAKPSILERTPPSLNCDTMTDT